MSEGPVIISEYKMFCRNYTPEELLSEITNLISSGEYEDFMFVAAGDIRSVRIGSKNKDLRVGDLLYLNQLIKEDIMNCE